MKTAIFLVSAVAIATIAPTGVTFAKTPISQSSSVAQMTDDTSIEAVNPIELNRAKNLARQAAEIENGGLTQYRAESSMHGSSLQSPFVDNGDGTWTFTFQGSSPGSTTPTVESVVTVDQTTYQVTVDYNGPIRDR